MGARSNSIVRAPTAFNNVNLVAVFLLLLLVSYKGVSISSSDADALLNFKKSLKNVVSLSSWDPSINPKPPCSGNISNWVGLFCLNDRVWGIRLESMGLTGNIDLESLAPMSALRTLSLMNNTFVGPLPNIKMLPNLRALYLSYNHFSGLIPDNAFVDLHRLRKLYLSNNEFTGNIPSSLSTLPILIVLRLDSNKFKGVIPNFEQKNKLKIVNFSNNELEGPIPPNLTTFDPSSFSGNMLLCGPPLKDMCQSGTTGKENSILSNRIVTNILLIVIMIAFIISIMVSIFIICRLRSQKKQLDHDNPSTNSQLHMQASSKYVKPPAIYVKTKSLADHYDPNSPKPDQPSHGNSKKGEQGKLIFLRQDGIVFDLQDLLRSSAEILGSASFGSSYKAVILDGQAVVVKRYKKMNNVSREEFHEHMRRIGNLNHPNVLPLLAFYYRREEKLLISSFVHNGCLASHLHGIYCIYDYFYYMCTCMLNMFLTWL